MDRFTACSHIHIQNQKTPPNPIKLSSPSKEPPPMGNPLTYSAESPPLVPEQYSIYGVTKQNSPIYPIRHRRRFPSRPQIQASSPRTHPPIKVAVWFSAFGPHELIASIISFRVLGLCVAAAGCFANGVWIGLGWNDYLLSWDHRFFWDLGFAVWGKWLWVWERVKRNFIRFYLYSVHLCYCTIPYNTIHLDMTLWTYVMKQWWHTMWKTKTPVLVSTLSMTVLRSRITVTWESGVKQRTHEPCRTQPRITTETIPPDRSEEKDSLCLVVTFITPIPCHLIR